MAMQVPDGVAVSRLTTHRDPRGSLTETFRVEWGTGVEPVQWNLVRSAPNVLRGMHVHFHHVDYYVLVSGTATLGLHDMRATSATRSCAATMTLSAEDMTAIAIPPGVLHGFYSPAESIFQVGLTAYWDPLDEHGCRWDDPMLGVAWPAGIAPILSPRDAGLPPLAIAIDALAAQVQ